MEVVWSGQSRAYLHDVSQRYCGRTTFGADGGLTNTVPHGDGGVSPYFTWFPPVKLDRFDHESNMENELSKPSSESTVTETALDVTAAPSSTVPWIGGPISNVLSGISFGRRIARVREVIEGLAEDLKDFKSQVSEQYVKTDEFEELLERALRKAADERNPEKRGLYRAFLSNLVRSPGTSYDNLVHLVRLLEQLPPDGLRVLEAIAKTPDTTNAPFGSPLHTLLKRLPGIGEHRIEELVAHLQTLGLVGTRMRSLKVTMTAHGDADLKHMLTPPGRVASLRQG